jgi:hypothetical protein
MDKNFKTEVLAGCIFVRVSPRECMVLQNVVNPINQFGLTMFNQNMVIYLVIMIYNMYIYIYTYIIYIYTYCTWWIYGDIIDTLDWFAWFWSRPNPLWRHWNNGNWIRESSQMALFHSISGLFNVSRIGERIFFWLDNDNWGLLSIPQLERMPLPWPLSHGLLGIGIGFTWVYHHTLWSSNVAMLRKSPSHSSMDLSL